MNANPSPPIRPQETRPPAPDRVDAALAATTSLMDLGTVFAQAIRGHGLQMYILGHLSGGAESRTIYLSNWSRAWMELYAANGFANEDIVIIESQVSEVPFTWAEMRARRMDVSKRMLEAAAGFGWHDGLIVPVHGADGSRGVVSMAGERLSLSEAERPRLVTTAKLAYARARDLHLARGKVAALTTRERQALALVAQGMDDSAIAVELGVTRSSAHVYVERAKRRLGTTTRAQAVALALDHGLL